MHKLLPLLVFLGLTACSTQVIQSQNHKKNRAYDQQLFAKVILPDVGPQFVILHPDILAQELEIEEGLTPLMKDLFWAGLISPLTDSKIQFEPSDRQLILSLDPVTTEIREDFQMKAFLPHQRIRPQDAKGILLIIHEWSLGYGLTSEGFYDINQSRQVSEPEKATTFSSILSYTLWDSNKAQVIQHGVVEAQIPRPTTWTTELFKELALKTNTKLHQQIGGI